MSQGFPPRTVPIAAAEQISDIVDEEVNNFINSSDAVRIVSPRITPESSQSSFYEEEVPPGMLETTTRASEALYNYIQFMSQSSSNIKDRFIQLLRNARNDIQRHSAVVQTIEESGVTFNSLLSNVKDVRAKLMLMGLFVKDSVNKAKPYLNAAIVLPGRIDELDRIGRINEVQKQYVERLSEKLKGDILRGRRFNSRNVSRVYDFFMNLAQDPEYSSLVNNIIQSEILKRQGHTIFTPNQITVAFVLHEMYASIELNPRIEPENILDAIEIPTSEGYVSFESFITSICESIFYLITGTSTSGRMSKMERDKLNEFISSAVQALNTHEGPGAGAAAAAERIDDSTSPRAYASQRVSALPRTEPRPIPSSIWRDEEEQEDDQTASKKRRRGGSKSKSKKVKKTRRHKRNNRRTRKSRK